MYVKKRNDENWIRWRADQIRDQPDAWEVLLQTTPTRISLSHNHEADGTGLDRDDQTLNYDEDTGRQSTAVVVQTES